MLIIALAYYSLSLLRFILYDVIAIATCATKLDFSNPHLARSVSSSLPLPIELFIIPVHYLFVYNLICIPLSVIYLSLSILLSSFNASLFLPTYTYLSI